MRTPLLFAFTMVMPGAAYATAPDHRPVRNSFVNRRVRSVADLLAQVRRDPVVADRYVRHFAMGRPAVLRYLSGLHRGSLAKAGRYTIYSVPQGGWLKMHVGRLPKGEPMFFDRTGRPTLVVRCGNPVTLGPKKKRRADDHLGLSTPEGTRTLLPTAEPEAAGLVDLVAETLDATVPTATALAGVPRIESSATVGASGAGSASHWFSFLSLLPGLDSLAHSGIAAHGPHGPFPPKAPPVPEPASLVVLAGGLAATVRKRVRKSAVRKSGEEASSALALP